MLTERPCTLLPPSTANLVQHLLYIYFLHTPAFQSIVAAEINCSIANVDCQVEVKKAKSFTANSLLGSKIDGISELASDTGAQSVYFPILKAFEQGGNKLRKKTTKTIVEEAETFYSFLSNYEGETTYRNDQGEEKQVRSNRCRSFQQLIIDLA